MKKISYFFMYMALQVVVCILRLFPLSFGRSFAKMLGSFAFYFVPIRRREVIKRLSDTFRDKSASEIWSLARDVYIQFTISMVEVIFLSKLSGDAIDEIVEFYGLETIERFKKEKKGIILVTGHFGNWELMGAALRKYIPVNVFAARLHNKYADRWINLNRRQVGLKIIYTDEPFRNVFKVLKRGEILAFLSDQDAHERGVFVDFLGRPSSTPRGAAIFALRTKLPMITSFIVRDGSKFKIYIEEVSPPQGGIDEEEAIRIYTQRYTKKLEEFIFKYPDHWFWFHRRWKSSPQVSD